MDPLLGSIILFGGNFNPRGWQLCQGQILAIAQNTALFSILGTTYGGNGQTTFALPDLRGRAPIGQGQGPGLSMINLGQVGGQPTTTLLSSNMPQHIHTLTAAKAQVQVSGNNPSTEEAAGAFLTNTASNFYAAAPSSGQFLGGGALSGTTDIAGGSQPFDNHSPYLGLNFIIAVEGVFPSRN